MFATQMGDDPDDSARIIHKALDAEIDLVDCVDRYGDAEEIVGMPMSDQLNEQSDSRRWISTVIQNSSHRLGAGRIDIYQLQ